jgi:hypothetical protein
MMKEEKSKSMMDRGEARPAESRPAETPAA